MITHPNCIKGAIKAGLAAHKNKTGIHGLSKEKKVEVAKKGKQAFLDKWQLPEFQELHKMKIRFGRVSARFDKLKPPPDAFGWS